jgi:hypothetical protein
MVLRMRAMDFFFAEDGKDGCKVGAGLEWHLV